MKKVKVLVTIESDDKNTDDALIAGVTHALCGPGLYDSCGHTGRFTAELLPPSENSGTKKHGETEEYRAQLKYGLVPMWHNPAGESFKTLTEAIDHAKASATRKRIRKIVDETYSGSPHLDKVTDLIVAQFGRIAKCMESSESNE